MRVVVTGSRYWTDEGAIRRRLERLPKGSVIVHGACPYGGADAIAHRLARRLGFDVEPHRPRVPYGHPDFGKACRERNLEMIQSGPDLCLAYPIGKSNGTRMTIKFARRFGVPVEITEGLQERDLRRLLPSDWFDWTPDRGPQ